MDVICTQCKIKIETEDINVAKDTAYCSSCQNLLILSSILEKQPNNNFDITQPVSGIKVEDNGYNWSMEASNRSITAIFLVPFTLVWAGGSLSGIYGSQLINGEFDPSLSLFGLPFLLGSIVLMTLTLMNIFGRTCVRNENGKALIFIGIGSFGWYRRFDWKNIDQVKEVNLHKNRHLSLEGNKRLNLGWGLSSEKRYFMSNFLRSKLKK
ncbi:hypothetical protein [Moritella sp.]|uniref:hypothetical protein n=1 Tax=Moritella sp. TaxID=78556 RepID=UPI001DC8D1D6|nr:hypothetical protein [Moritella sp.]MCJ8351534.1 hypothetical protein [Moritella sp.]NQZ38495.1 hypothetical protein [Moritella sp.]